MRAPLRTSGFTLVEVTLALTLLAAMLAMLFAGLRTAARAWDAGSARGDRADQVALTTAFVRREIAAAFPWRLKDPAVARLAFDGDSDGLRFVSMRPADVGAGGLAFVSIRYERGAGRESGRLVMRRVMAAASESDFSSLDAAKPFTILEDVESARFSYFGADSDTSSPAWADQWQGPRRLPTHVRMKAKLASVDLPEIVVALRVGEEAGCVEAGFQRDCVPRR